MTIYLGNLSVEQIEKDYSVTFADDDKQWLEKHHQPEANKIQSDKWHFFDIPRIMMAGSKEFALEIYNVFQKYSFKGQFGLAW